MKKLKLSIFLSLLLFLIHQAAGQEWMKTIGYDGSDRAVAVAPTDDGGLIVAMRLSDQDSLGYWHRHVLLSSYDQEGEINWEIILDFEDDIEAYDLIKLNDENYLFMGSHIGNLSNGYTVLVKLNVAGEIIWNKKYDAPSLGILATSIAETSSGNLYLSGRYFGSNPSEMFLMKVSNNGDQEWIKTYADIGSEAITDSQFGQLIVAGIRPIISGSNVNGEPIILKFDYEGNIEEEISIDSTYTHHIEYLTQTSEGDLLLAGSVQPDSTSINTDIWYSKINNQGDIIWSFTKGIENVWMTDHCYHVTILSDGNYLFSGNYQFPGSPSTPSYGWILKCTPNGETIWERQFGDSSAKQFFFNEAMETANGKIAAVGTMVRVNQDALILYFDEQATISPLNVINGTVFYDEGNCLYDSTESTLENWFVSVEENGTAYQSSDSTGNYSFFLFDGNYEVSLQTQGPYWEVCENNFEVIFDDTLNFDTAIIDFAVNSIADCPYLRIDLATPFLRRCFPSTYHVNYCNDGTTAADSAYVEIVLDSFLTYLGSSIPLTSQSGDTLTFQLDTVGIGECGNFTFEVEVSCDAELGQPHCTEAHIFPDSLCIPSPSWSGAEIQVEGSCANDTVFFNVQNIGNAPTSQTLPFLVIEDDVILFQGDLPVLEPQQVEEYHYVATGMTYRMEAEQEPNYPGGWSNPSATVEACGSGGFSFGFTNQFPQDDQSPFVDIDCRENIGSYDPNDKQGFPTGWGDEHFIEQNTDIEYLIRFQNTGTDTAFWVVIRDTLSPFLDPASVRPGVASHPYQFDLLGSGVLKFTFNDILLPDSSTNLAASQGFVKFRISQKQNVPLESVIENSAAIYFDFNAPIITNTTWHTVGQDLLNAIFEIENDENQNLSVIVRPNPFSEKTILEIMGMEMPGENILKLFDGRGRLVLSKKFSGIQTELDGRRLQSGIYFFQIENKTGEAVLGKVVVFK